jgi:hypothetical protein
LVYAQGGYDIVLPKNPPTAPPLTPRPRPDTPNLDRPEPPDLKRVYNYELKPDHGPYLVCVRSFKGSIRSPEEDKRVKELAEGFATYIRSECRLNAYVLERGWVQRQERAKEKAEYLTALTKYYKDRGEEIPEHYLKIKMARIPDEYNVFVAPARGVLKDLDAAIDFAKQVRQLKAPPAEFSDAIYLGEKADARTAINPFLSAFPGPNPTIPKKVDTVGGIKRPIADDFLMNLNANEPYSLIHKTKKMYTILVQSYGIQNTVVVGDKAGATSDDGGERLERAAQQANDVVKLLRSGKPAFDAYVLHTRYYSVVTVGQYDSPEDPTLKANLDALAGMKFKDQKTGKVLGGLMDKPGIIMIPRPQ